MGKMYFKTWWGRERINSSHKLGLIQLLSVELNKIPSHSGPKHGVLFVLSSACLVFQLEWFTVLLQIRIRASRVHGWDIVNTKSPASGNGKVQAKGMWLWQCPTVPGSRRGEQSSLTVCRNRAWMSWLEIDAFTASLFFSGLFLLCSVLSSSCNKESWYLWTFSHVAILKNVYLFIYVHTCVCVRVCAMCGEAFTGVCFSLILELAIFFFFLIPSNSLVLASHRTGFTVPRCLCECWGMDSASFRFP